MLQSYGNKSYVFTTEEEKHKTWQEFTCSLCTVRVLTLMHSIQSLYVLSVLSYEWLKENGLDNKRYRCI